MSLADLLILRVSSQEPKRLDQLVLEALRARDPRAPLSRGLLKKFFRENPLILDGRSGAKASIELEGRHTIELRGWNEFLADACVLRPAENCFLPILYEDGDLLILNKASGIPSVALSGAETRTAVAAALARVPSLASIAGAKPLEPGLLHRLDTATSGILAFAKSAEELARLRSAWKTPDVKKFYRAIVEPEPGTPVPSCQSLRDPIAHSASSASRMLVIGANSRASETRGKALAALTHIREVRPVPVGRFELMIEIETGVMHQIRAHLASRGWPIAGDRIYNPAVRGARAQPASSEPRLRLHAWKLELPLRSGTELRITALAPEAEEPDLRPSQGID